MAHYGFGRPLNHNVVADGNGGHAETENSSRATLDERIAAAKSRDTQQLLERLERGEISRDVYLDLRVEEAIAPFAKTMGHNQIEFMRIALRDQLESDPVLVDLVRRATELSSTR